MDLSDTIIPKSDQINADDLIAGPQTFTVREVKRGAAEQPVDIMLVETERAYRPSKSMRRVLVTAWGNEGAAYAGRKLTLYRDPEVRFGGDKVGGIKISHLSHIDGPLSVMLTATRGSRKPHSVAVLTNSHPAPLPVEQRIEMALASFRSIGITAHRLEAKLGLPLTQWGAQQVDQLGAWYTAITKDGVDADSLLPEPTDSRQSVPGGTPAVEDGTPTALGEVPDATGEVGSEQRLPISPVGASVVSGVKANLRRGQLTAIGEDFARLLGEPVDPEEMLWWSGLIVAHPVTALDALGTEDLRKLQSRLNRLRDREQLEAELGLKGGE